MGIKYSRDYLKIIPEINFEDMSKTIDLNVRYSLTKLLDSRRNVEEFGIGHIHALAKVEGGTYRGIDIEIFLKYGKTPIDKEMSETAKIYHLSDDYYKVMSKEHKFDYNLLCNVHLDLVEDDWVKEAEIIHEIAEGITNPYSKAIYLHLNSNYIQFLSEGSKRSARLFQNVVLIENNLLPLLFNKRQLEGYKESLMKYYQTGEQKEYIRWFVDSYMEVYAMVQEQPRLPKRNLTE